MDSAFAWLSQIIEWFGQFIPKRELVDPTHRALKFVRGKPGVTLQPGMHFYWPITTTFFSHPIVRQAIDLRSQTFMTTDEVTAIAGGLVVYEVSDVELLVGHTYDPDITIREIAIGEIHGVLCSMTWSEIRTTLAAGKLDTRLRVEVRKALEKYGVRVLNVTLTDLAKCRVIKLFNSNSVD